MAKLGPEFIGKLPPGAAEDLALTLDEYREAARDGIIDGVMISSCGDCAISEAQKAVVYLVGQVPALPLPGCVRSPCCGCCYTAKG